MLPPRAVVAHSRLTTDDRRLSVELKTALAVLESRCHNSSYGAPAALGLIAVGAVVLRRHRRRTARSVAAD
jgi:MYXO-CTERM domain-containing protein